MRLLVQICEVRMTYYQIPATLADVLKDGERIVCKNASVIVNGKDEFVGWIDNDSMIVTVVGEEET